jgi:Co/Zn/Cd efflux system component
MNAVTLSPRAAERLAGIARVMWTILGLNLVVAVAKLAYGYRSGAIAITADGIHSLLDSASNVIGLIGISVAGRPADSNHPYGHRKYETFAALGVAVMLFFGCYEIITTAIERLRNPRLPHVDAIGYGVLGLTLVINALVVVYERREARRLQSELLESDAAHTGSDVFATLLVFASFVAAHFRLQAADVVAAALIVVLIVRAECASSRTRCPRSRTSAASIRARSSRWRSRSRAYAKCTTSGRAGRPTTSTWICTSCWTRTRRWPRRTSAVIRSRSGCASAGRG